MPLRKKNPDIFFFLVPGGKSENKGFKLQEGRFQVNDRTVQHWKHLSREVGDSS